MSENTKRDFKVDRLTEDFGVDFSPARYALISKNDAVIQPYKTYELFYEMTFEVIQKLGMYEDIGSLEECKQAAKRMQPKGPLAASDRDGNKYAICPYCSETVSDGSYFFYFCPSCGQKIDWNTADQEADDKYPSVDAKVKFTPAEEWDIPEGAINFAKIDCDPEDRYLISCNSCGQISIVDSSHGHYCPICGPGVITPIISRKVTKKLVNNSEDKESGYEKE